MALTMAKRVEKVSLVMKKHGIPDHLRAQVIFELDDSGSAVPMYNNGQMQELTERLMAVALRLDVDGKLEVYSFSDRAHKHGDVNASQIDGYIQRDFIPEAKRGGTWSGGTDYARAVAASLAGNNAVAKAKGFFGGLFGKKTAAPATYPNFHLFVSDGQDMGDHRSFLKQISEATNDYFVLVGVGPKSYFQLMQKAADDFGNVGFVNFPDLSISDDVMYEQLLAKEALEWLLAKQPST